MSETAKINVSQPLGDETNTIDVSNLLNVGRLPSLDGQRYVWDLVNMDKYIHPKSTRILCKKLAALFISTALGLCVPLGVNIIENQVIKAQFGTIRDPVLIRAAGNIEQLDAFTDATLRDDLFRTSENIFNLSACATLLAAAAGGLALSANSKHTRPPIKSYGFLEDTFGRTTS